MQITPAVPNDGFLQIEKAFDQCLLQIHEALSEVEQLRQKAALFLNSLRIAVELKSESDCAGSDAQSENALSEGWEDVQLPSPRTSTTTQLPISNPSLTRFRRRRQ
jgi:hypothetical protein